MPRGLILSLMLLAPAASGAPAPAGDGNLVQFMRDVAPVLVARCQGCHGPQKQKGGYRLDTFDRLMRPGDSEAAPISPGRPEASDLFRLIVHPDEKKRMPRDGDALSPEQVATIERWIRDGARFDGPDRGASIQNLIRVTHPRAPSTYPHPLPAVALAFTPDGSALAVGGYHEITLWDAATGRLLRRIGDVAQQTHALAYSPDGSLLVVAGGTPGSLGELRLLSTHDPSTPRVLERIGDVMLAAAFSPDGARLAGGGADGALRVYTVATGERTLMIEPHADWITAVAFSPDGTKVATASRDKSARVFEVATGELVSAYLGQDNLIFALAWDPDGKRLNTGGRDHEIHTWEPAFEAKKVRELKGFAGDVLRLAVLGDHVYSTSADGKLRQHNRTTGELLQTIPITPDYLPGLAASPRTHTIATGSFDGSVHLYATDAAKPLTPRTHFTAAP